MAKLDPTIIIIDDNELDRRFLSTNLRKILPQAKISEASSLAEGLNALETIPCDIAFLDMHLGRDDASPILKKYPAKDRNFPIIMLTGDRTEATLDLAFESGADDFVPKPIDAEMLELKTKAALTGRSLSPLSFYGKREGIVKASVTCDVQLVYLSEFKFLLLAPFSLNAGACIRIFWNNVPLPLKVSETKKTNDPSKYMIQGELQLEHIPDEQRISLRKSLIS